MKPSVEAVGRACFQCEGRITVWDSCLHAVGRRGLFTVPSCVPMASVGQENYLMPSQPVASFPVVSGSARYSLDMIVSLCLFLYVSVSVPSVSPRIRKAVTGTVAP